MTMFLENVPKLPKRLSIILNSESVLLPGCIKTYPISNPKIKSILANKLKNKQNQSNIIGVINSTGDGVIGTAGFIHKVSYVSLIVLGLCRFRINKIIKTEPHIVAEVTQLDMHTDCTELNNDLKINELAGNIHEAILPLFEYDSSSLIKENLSKVPPCYLAEICSQLIMFSFEDQLKILNTLDVAERLELSAKIIKNKKTEIVKKPNLVIRLPSNLNNRGAANPELKKLEERLKEIKFPPNIEKIVNRDFQNLSRISSFNPDYGVVFSYLTLMTELPWNKQADEILDLHKSKIDMEVDHFGLQNVKKRILEYLAVRKLRNGSDNNSHQGPILCLVGPPGVGKTSIARSIASTLNRPFERVSLGGVSNMSEIRGHRRTYVSAMPGRIIQAIKSTGVKNPVILLDEIEKMTVGMHGNPAAALLEVLDPSQNKEFLDHYLNVPFDLSEVMFIATANSTKKLSPALYDRLEIIKISGYTYLEKIQIALNHLLPKQLKETGLNEDQIKIPEGTLQFLITHYTREAGVRGLERKIGSLCRAVAVRIAMNENLIEPFVLDIDSTKEILGPVLCENNKWTARLGKAGVAIGLVVSNAGGDTLAVESSFMPGSGKLVLTGSLGGVIKESAQLAWGWVRANAYLYGVDLDGKRLSTMDVHIHFPEGAVNKDGPSAGVTVATALMSLFLDRPLLPSIAMTGEITLQGLVLPVGGIKEKVIAAHKDGFTKIIIPQQNGKNLHDIPLNIKNEISFVLVSDMHAIIETAFEGGVNIIMPHCIKSKI